MLEQNKDSFRIFNEFLEKLQSRKCDFAFNFCCFSQNLNFSKDFTML